MFTVIGYNFAERYEYSIWGAFVVSVQLCLMKWNLFFFFHDGIELKKKKEKENNLQKKNEIHKINRFQPKNTHKMQKGIRYPIIPSNVMEIQNSYTKS